MQVDFTYCTNKGYPSLMGRLNTDGERAETLKSISSMRLKTAPFVNLKFSSIADELYEYSKAYFALCAMARGKSKYKSEANNRLFATRVKIENNISTRALKTIKRDQNEAITLLKQKFFGGSKKQGLSIRLPLSSCEPTKLCSNLCYAHDVLDASPAAVIRGSLNGVIAKLFEDEPDKYVELLAKYWDPWIVRAIKTAEQEQAISNFQRKPRIRFGHVGDGAAYPKFMNFLASRFHIRANGRIQSVIYTRHRLAKQLDTNLFVVNFTLDPVSEERIRFAPKRSRIVYSAFGGQTSKIAEINFLEHHRHEHFKQIGLGNVCPATEPSEVVRSCDALKCDKCFIHTETNADRFL